LCHVEPICYRRCQVIAAWVPLQGIGSLLLRAFLNVDGNGAGTPQYGVDGSVQVHGERFAADSFVGTVVEDRYGDVIGAALTGREAQGAALGCVIDPGS